MMVGDLIISSLGVLPAALTPGEVKVGNRVLNGRYQQKAGETDVYQYKKEDKPRYQKSTKVAYERPASELQPRKSVKPFCERQRN